MTGNIIYRNGWNGISIFRSGAVEIVGNYVGENSDATVCLTSCGSALYSGIHIYDTTHSNNAIIIDNKLTPNVTGKIKYTAPSLAYAFANQGFNPDILAATTATKLNTGAATEVGGGGLYAKQPSNGSDTQGRPFETVRARVLVRSYTPVEC